MPEWSFGAKSERAHDTQSEWGDERASKQARGRVRVQQCTGESENKTEGG